MSTYACGRAPCLFPNCQCDAAVQPSPVSIPVPKNIPWFGWFCPSCKSYHAPSCETCPAPAKDTPNV